MEDNVYRYIRKNHKKRHRRQSIQAFQWMGYPKQLKVNNEIFICKNRKYTCPYYTNQSIDIHLYDDTIIICKNENATDIRGMHYYLTANYSNPNYLLRKKYLDDLTYIIDRPKTWVEFKDNIGEWIDFFKLKLL